MTDSSNRKKLITAIEQLRKTHGDNVVSTLRGQHLDFLDTGIPALHAALGTPGFARRRMYEIFGQESSGKTLLMTTAARTFGKNGLTTLYIDYEESLKEDFLIRQGLELGGSFLVIQPSTLEDGFNKALPLLRTGAIDVLIIDSIGAMTPEDRLSTKRKAGEKKIGDLSLALSIEISKLWAIRNEANCTYIFINQMRSRIANNGSDETTPGGKSLKFYASCRLRILKKQTLKSGGISVGQEMTIRSEKNKLAPPWTSGSIKMFYAKGIDIFSSVVDDLISSGVVSLGSTGWIKSEEFGVSIRGRDEFAELIRGDIALADKLLSKLSELNPVPLISEEEYEEDGE